MKLRGLQQPKTEEIDLLKEPILIGTRFTYVIY
jgi:hypothetical protein